MHHVISEWYELWSWLLENGASRSTAILVLITGAYAILTWRMARAIAQQTRAMIQPVALLTFHWEHQQRYHPNSYFQIKNLGAQPLLLLDVRLQCHFRGRLFTEHFELWEQHIIPPGNSLDPVFDFEPELRNESCWDMDELSYSLRVVTSDLSKQIVLTYESLPVLHLVTVRRGMPLTVRWRYFVKPLVWRYHRVFHKLKPPKA